MSTVQLKNVKKAFGKTEVLHGIDLDIKHGEFVVFVGPSLSRRGERSARR